MVFGVSAVFGQIPAYAPVKNRIVATDKDTGKTLWSSRKLDGDVVETLVVRDMVVVRTKKRLIYALENGGGLVLWTWRGAKGSLTNMLLSPDQKLLIVADKSNLIGLDLDGEGVPAEVLRAPVLFPIRNEVPVMLSMNSSGAIAIQGKTRAVTVDPQTFRVLP